MTDEEVFLDWCDQNNLKPSLTNRDSSGPTYRFQIVMVKIEDTVGMNKELGVNPHQECDQLEVNFRRDGSWLGGTNLIWNNGLPWMGRKRRRLTTLN